MAAALQDVGKEVAELLCEEIAAGGCVDSSVQVGTVGYFHEPWRF